jgi:hypothetical protein
VGKGKDKTQGCQSGDSPKDLSAVYCSVSGSLVNLTNKVSQARRDSRWRSRAVMQAVSIQPRLRACGHYVTSNAGGVSVCVKHGEGGASGYIRGVALCGSIWSCPVCSAKIRHARSVELQAALVRHLATGGGVYTGISTVAHQRFDSLESVWTGLQKGFTAAFGGSGWLGTKRHKGDKERFRVVGVIRIGETTYGVNGWHPHFHYLILTAAPLSKVDQASMSSRIYARYSQKLETLGMECREDLHGIEPIRCSADIARYFMKIQGFEGVDKVEASKAGSRLRGAVLEHTRTDLKKGKAGGMTPFQILDAIASEEDGEKAEALVSIWREWEAVSRGRRFMGWSKGLRALLCLAEEKTDQELAEADAGGDSVCDMTKDEWRSLRKASAVLLAIKLAEEGVNLGAILSAHRSAVISGQTVSWGLTVCHCAAAYGLTRFVQGEPEEEHIIYQAKAPKRTKADKSCLVLA